MAVRWNNIPPGLKDSLQDLLSDTEITEVGHVMIVDHLDLTTMAAEDRGSWAMLDLDGYSSSPRSIRVRYEPNIGAQSHIL